MYPPTFHPGVYERPERLPYLDVGALFGVLLRPKETFEDLYDHTTATQGIILAIMFTVLSSAIGIITSIAIIGSMDIPDEASIPLLVETNVAMAVVGIFTSIAAFFLTAWLFHAFIKSNARRPSLDKTMGMMGYAMFPAFIIMMIINITFPLIAVGVDWEDVDETNVGAVCGVFAVILGLGLVGLIWAWWVHSNAQSVANDISNGTAFGFLFLTWICVGILMAVVGAVISVAVLGTSLGV